MKEPIRKRLVICLATGILLLSLVLGFWLAAHKPVWNDEIYTQTAVVERITLPVLLSGRFEEGNNCPLFYLLQKTVCRAFDYQFPKVWNGEWTLPELQSQIIMRVQPNVMMSLSIALIFWYFARYYSLSAGGYALVVTLSSYMVGAYGLEARPYALWFFLTTLQSLLLLAILQGRVTWPRMLKALVVTNLLLSITVVFSLVQILSVALILVLARKATFKQVLLTSVVPVCICLYYYFSAPKFQFWFAQGPWQLVGASFPKDRILILLMYVLTLMALWIGRRKTDRTLCPEQVSASGLYYFVFTALMLASAFAVLLIFKLNESSGQKGFMISNRYFIYLAPVGAIAVILFSIEMIRTCRKKIFLLIPLLVGLSGLTAFRVYRTVMLLRDTYRF